MTNFELFKKRAGLVMKQFDDCLNSDRVESSDFIYYLDALISNLSFLYQELDDEKKFGSNEIKEQY